MNRNRHAAIFVRMMAIREISAKYKLKKLFVSQGKLIAREYADSGEHAIDKFILAGEHTLNKLLVGFYAESSRSFADYTLGQIGQKPLATKGFHFDNFNNIVNSFIHHSALTRAKQINATTEKIIKKVLVQGQNDGLGIEKIAKNIRDKYDEMSIWRSATIARTELHNAATFGSQAIAEQSDLELIREWAAVDDDRTREDHSLADGQQQDMDTPFDVGGESLDRPGDGSAENSINCRCSIMYVPK